MSAHPKPAKREKAPRKRIARTSPRIRTRRPLGTVRKEAKDANQIDPLTWAAVMRFSHFQRLREWLLDESSIYIGDDTIATAEANERVRADRLEQPSAKPEDLARIRRRWADYEANRAPKFLRGEFRKRK